LISRKKLIELYAAMVKCRMLAERAKLLVQQGKLVGAFDLPVGQEAEIAGVTADLLPGDTLYATRGAMIPALIKGIPFKPMFSSLATNGKTGVHSATKRNGRGAGLSSAASLTAACNAAKAHKATKNGKVAVFFCEEQIDPDPWRTKLSYASQRNLPILFVFRQGAKISILENRIANANKPEALASGIPVITVQGNDVVAVYRVASESIARARQRRGPTLIECTGSFDLRSPDAANNERCVADDPILAMEIFLAGKGIYNAKLKRQVEGKFSFELDMAARFLTHQTKKNRDEQATPQLGNREF
jgi:TPP-dependent pyruvate/acetoin dehydrogenase alpha subunit